MELTKAAAAVLAERRRQIETEGWTPKHDDAHYSGDLAAAAASYAAAAAYMVAPGSPRDHYTADDPPEMWPPEWEFKPGSARSMLVKAGALILAEIERIDRSAPVYGPDNPPRLRKPGESVEEYRRMMGWGTKTPNSNSTTDSVG